MNKPLILNTHLKLFLPVDTEEQRTVSNTLEQLAALEFKGFTSYPGLGGYVNHAGELQKEPCNILELFVYDSLKAEAFVETAAALLGAIGEECFLYSLNGTGYLVEL